MIKRYKFKIIPENGGFVGFALLNDEVAYQTNVCSSSQIASLSLTELVQKNQQVGSKKDSTTTLKQINFKTIPVSAPSAIPSAPKKCCGRG